MKAGIVVDNYKVPMFEKALREAGFTYDKFRFTDGTTTVRVECLESQLSQVKALCTKVNSAAFHKKQGEN